MIETGFLYVNDALKSAVNASPLANQKPLGHFISLNAGLAERLRYRLHGELKRPLEPE